MKLVTVFANGELLVDQTFEEIRARAAITAADLTPIPTADAVCDVPACCLCNKAQVFFLCVCVCFW